MTGQTFAQALADDGRIANVGTTIASNPEQSKHLETTRVKMEELEVDLVNLRSEKYTADSRIPTMVSMPSHRGLWRVLTGVMDIGVWHPSRGRTKTRLDYQRVILQYSFE